MADRDRVEREIEDILQKIDDFPTEAARIRQRRKREARGPSLAQRLGTRLRGFSAPQLLLAGMIIVLISYFIIGRADETIGRAGIIAGLVLFFASFALSFRPSPSQPRRGGGTEKRWRGRVIDIDGGERRGGLWGWWTRR